MKNKAFISFCINLLVGILFSFPVFSAQNNVQNIDLTKSEFSSLSSETATHLILGNSESNSKFFTNEKDKKLLHKKFYKRNSTPGNKNQSKIVFPPHPPIEIVISDLTRNCGLNPNYVNITYLKDLRTTKMLC